MSKASRQREKERRANELAAYLNTPEAIGRRAKLAAEWPHIPIAPHSDEFALGEPIPPPDPIEP